MWTYRKINYRDKYFPPHRNHHILEPHILTFNLYVWKLCQTSNHMKINHKSELQLTIWITCIHFNNNSFVFNTSIHVNFIDFDLSPHIKFDNLEFQGSSINTNIQFQESFLDQKLHFNQNFIIFIDNFIFNIIFFIQTRINYSCNLFWFKSWNR